MKLSVALFLAPSIVAACIPVATDRIAGGQLAKADPALAAFPAALTVGFAPTPGTPRVLSSSEIVRIAKANGVTLSAAPPDVCFEFALRHLTNDEAVGSMMTSLPPTATVEIIELTSSQVPAGDLRFPLNGLEAGRDINTWRGYVQYTPTRRFPIQTRVRVSNNLEALVLVSDVARGAPLTRESFRVQPMTGLTLRSRIATRPEEVVGTVAKTALKAGDSILLTSLELPPTVRRGDVIRVDVQCGPAHLQLDAVAQKAARNGEVVELLNPISGKIFKARLDGSKAIVSVGSGL